MRRSDEDGRGEPEEHDHGNAGRVELDAWSISAGAVATIGAIVLVAHAYTRLCARHAGVSHALGVGIAWLVLAIGCEIVVSNRPGRPWQCCDGTLRNH